MCCAVPGGLGTEHFLPRGEPVVGSSGGADLSAGFLDEETTENLNAAMHKNLHANNFQDRVVDFLCISLNA